MALNSKDVQKVLKAGFTIIREDYQRMAIKHKTFERADWHDLNKGFESKAAMRRQMDIYLQLSTIIED